VCRSSRPSSNRSGLRAASARATGFELALEPDDPIFRDLRTERTFEALHPLIERLLQPREATIDEGEQVLHSGVHGLDALGADTLRRHVDGRGSRRARDLDDPPEPLV